MSEIPRPPESGPESEVEDEPTKKVWNRQFPDLFTLPDAEALKAELNAKNAKLDRLYSVQEGLEEEGLPVGRKLKARIREVLGDQTTLEQVPEWARYEVTEANPSPVENLRKRAKHMEDARAAAEMASFTYSSRSKGGLAGPDTAVGTPFEKAFLALKSVADKNQNALEKEREPLHGLSLSNYQYMARLILEGEKHAAKRGISLQQWTQLVKLIARQYQHDSSNVNFMQLKLAIDNSFIFENGEIRLKGGLEVPSGAEFLPEGIVIDSGKYLAILDPQVEALSSITVYAAGKLILKGCDSLKELDVTFRDGKFEVENCPNLTELPELPDYNDRMYVELTGTKSRELHKWALFNYKNTHGIIQLVIDESKIHKEDAEHGLSQIEGDGDPDSDE